MTRRRRPADELRAPVPVQGHRLRDPAAVARLLLRAGSAAAGQRARGRDQGRCRRSRSPATSRRRGRKYPPGLPVPAAPDSAEAKAGGGGASTGGRGRLMTRARCWRGVRRRGGAAGRGVAAGAWPRGRAADAAARPRRRAGGRAAAAAKPPSAERAHRVHGRCRRRRRRRCIWGKKKLGVIAPHAPLIVQRPRDSGPLDVVVRADGCVPVQTRAYTFEDSKVAVKVTPIDREEHAARLSRGAPRRRRRRAAPAPDRRRRRALDGRAPATAADAIARRALRLRAPAVPKNRPIEYQSR